MPVCSLVKSSGNASNICFTLATASSDCSCSWQTSVAPIFCCLNIFLIHDTFHPYWMLKSHHILTKMNWPLSSHNTRGSCTVDHCMCLHLDELRNCLYSRMGKLDCQNGRLHQKVRSLWKQFRTWVQSSWPGLSPTHWVTDAEIQLMRLWHTQKLLILMPMVHLLLTKALDIVQGQLTAWQELGNIIFIIYIVLYSFYKSRKAFNS